VSKKKQKPGGWLFKEEPGIYSYFRLEQEGSTLWAGVKNALARRHLWSVKAGNRVLYYHTGQERAIVGEMRVLADATTDSESDDPKAVVVKVEPVKRWHPPVTLEQIKQDSLFAGWELIRLPRLSVMPVSPAQWERLEELCRTNAHSEESA
jgi:predicted RNA-binding protein with PUA-like domain